MQTTPTMIYKCLTRLFVLVVMLEFSQTSCSQAKSQGSEVIYHVFQRSFYDSNGDLQGDLNGLKEKLSYLQELGITSILLLPLYESPYYHNYFSSDFEKIDTEYGSMNDYLNLVKEIHKRGMKIYLDMETQYVTEDHVWWKDSYGNLNSKYSDYVLYDDSAHKKPSTIVFDLTELPGYDGTRRKITTVNLKSENVIEYNYRLFEFFTDPNHDGKFDDGADGFRIDHMMDNLDNKPQLKNLFSSFWAPLISRLKKRNPELKFVAEQADWASFGFDYLQRGGVDGVFAFRLMFAIRNMNKKEIVTMADSIFNFTPPGKQQIVFIANHDLDRFSSVIHQSAGKEKIGAALNLLIGGIPSIYYGQEIGMVGTTSWNKYGLTDANGIPQREAFEWYRSVSGKGMATWYKNTGPWWDSTNLKANDGISVEEQKTDPNSLWSFYRKLIALRKNNEAFFKGDYQTLRNDNDSVYCFVRYTDRKAAVVSVNLSSARQTTGVSIENMKASVKSGQWKNLLGHGTAKPAQGGIMISLPAYGIQVWEIL